MAPHQVNSVVREKSGSDEPTPAESVPNNYFLPNRTAIRFDDMANTSKAIKDRPVCVVAPRCLPIPNKTMPAEEDEDERDSDSTASEDDDNMHAEAVPVYRANNGLLSYIDVSREGEPTYDISDLEDDADDDDDAVMTIENNIDEYATGEDMDDSDSSFECHSNFGDTDYTLDNEVDDEEEANRREFGSDTDTIEHELEARAMALERQELLNNPVFENNDQVVAYETDEERMFGRIRGQPSSPPPSNNTPVNNLEFSNDVSEETSSRSDGLFEDLGSQPTSPIPPNNTPVHDRQCSYDATEEIRIGERINAGLFDWLSSELLPNNVASKFIQNANHNTNNMQIINGADAVPGNAADDETNSNNDVEAIKRLRATAKRVLHRIRNNLKINPDDNSIFSGEPFMNNTSDDETDNEADYIRMDKYRGILIPKVNGEKCTAICRHPKYPHTTVRLELKVKPELPVRRRPLRSREQLANNAHPYLRQSHRRHTTMSRPCIIETDTDSCDNSDRCDCICKSFTNTQEALSSDSEF